MTPSQLEQLNWMLAGGCVWSAVGSRPCELSDWSPVPALGANCRDASAAGCCSVPVCPRSKSVDVVSAALSSIAKTSSQTWHLPFRPRISSWPSKSCWHFGHEKTNFGDSAVSDSGLSLIRKMYWQLRHCPFVPSKLGGQRKGFWHLGQGTWRSSFRLSLPLWTSIMPTEAGSGISRIALQAGHSHWLPWLPSGTLNSRAQVSHANSMGMSAAFTRGNGKGR